MEGLQIVQALVLVSVASESATVSTDLLSHLLSFPAPSDTLGVLARTIGSEHFCPLAHECILLGAVSSCLVAMVTWCTLAG